MKTLLLIMNPAAGQRRAARFLAEIVALFSEYGYENIVYMTARRGDGTKIAAENAHRADLVVCVGGDGTLNEVIAGVLSAGADVPIGYIPAGSTNDFAASLNLSKNVIRAARDIMEGTPQTLDVGSFNGRYFSYVASFGAFTEASYSTPQQVKNALGHVAYLLEGVKELTNLRPVRLRFEADGKAYEGNYIYGAISNATSIGGILSMDKDQVDMNDGLFEATLIHMPENLIDLSAIVHALTTRQYNMPLIDFFKAGSIRILNEQETPWTLDGEYEKGAAEIEVKNLHSVIRLQRRAQAGAEPAENEN